MTRTIPIPTAFGLCSLAALTACTMNVPRPPTAYAAPSTATTMQPQYETYTPNYGPAGATAAPYVAAPAQPVAAVQTAATAEEAPAPQGSPLVVRDLTTRKVTTDGQMRLMVEGDIVNVSPVRQTAAALYGKVLDSQDTVLRNLPMPNWSPVVVLPGASLHFRIDTPVPPPPAARVRVTVGT